MHWMTDITVQNRGMVKFLFKADLVDRCFENWNQMHNFIEYHHTWLGKYGNQPECINPNSSKIIWYDLVIHMGSLHHLLLDGSRFPPLDDNLQLLMKWHNILYQSVYTLSKLKEVNINLFYNLYNKQMFIKRCWETVVSGRCWETVTHLSAGVSVSCLLFCRVKTYTKYIHKF